MTDPSESDDVPMAVQNLIDTWRSSGSRPQGRFPWPRAAWVASFPEIDATTIDLPELIGRGDVRRRAQQADREPEAARRSFIIAMAWGYGAQGYGRFRTARVLDDPAATTKLHDVVTTLYADGAIAAYQRMATDCRLRYLGPAFGTKFLYFCDPGRWHPKALILDRLVGDWWHANLGQALNPWAWDSDTYARYLVAMDRWARRLECESDDLETLMFRSEASRLGLRWALNEVMEEASR